MMKMQNKETGEISYFDADEVAFAKKTGVKLVNKFKRSKTTELLSELEEVDQK